MLTINIISNSVQAAALVRAELPKEQKEERVFVLPLGADGKVLSKPILVSVGYKDGTSGVDVRSILAESLKLDAHEIIVAHNHPSGNPTPSKEDIETTIALQKAAEIVGLELLDHIVIGSEDSAGGDGFISIMEYL